MRVALARFVKRRETKGVELRGLESLTFSLRRHGVDLIGREHGVIDVQVAAAGAPWLHRGGTHGAHG